jgi:hypothetical protein
VNINPISALLMIAFVYPVLRGFIRAFSSDNLKSDLYGVEGDISFMVSAIFGIYLLKRIFLQPDEGLFGFIYDLFPRQLVISISTNPYLLYLLVLPAIVYILFKTCRVILMLFNYLAFYPLIEVIEVLVKNRSKFFKRIIGALAEIPKSICYVLIITLVINLLSQLNFDEKINSHVESSKSFKYLSKEVIIPVTNSKLARQLPSILNNSFKMQVVESADVINNASNTRTIIYYNGVTLEEGIKSNGDIDKFARELTANDLNDKAKAKSIYTWIGQNLTYDHDKAAMVLNNNFDIRSGAISAFEERKGICFDYACLYVAMCRAVGLNVRLITGDGFNGVSWVSHAWNQVYISEEAKWINVDATFYNGGNYFNSRRFDLDHRNDKIAGEW